MKAIPFLAHNAAEALAKIHAQLGPDAVVVSVRRLPAQGLARLWQNSAGIEVLATVPEPDSSRVGDCARDSTGYQPVPFGDPPNGTGGTNCAGATRFGERACSVVSPGQWPGGTGESPVLPKLVEVQTLAGRAGEGIAALESAAALLSEGGTPNPARLRSHCAWRTIALLESMGLLPLNSERVLHRLQTVHGDAPPDSLAEELALTRAVLTEFWRPAPPLDGPSARRPHVFIGPAGAGKTTVLCKWLTHAALLEGRTARVWRLDGATANTAELLSVYGEILGVPVERFWREPGTATEAEFSFIDLPGVESTDPAAVRELGERLRALPSPHIHLVLNAAYETPILVAQLRAFLPLGPHDLVFTHLDEETRPMKLWNFVLGTNCSIRFLCGGQNIPGRFVSAVPEHFFPTRFQRE